MKEADEPKIKEKKVKRRRKRLFNISEMHHILTIYEKASLKVKEVCFMSFTQCVSGYWHTAMVNCLVHLS